MGSALLAAIALVSMIRAPERAAFLLADNLTATTGGTTIATGDTRLAANFATDAITYELDGVTLLLQRASIAGQAELAIYSDACLEPGSLVGLLTPSGTGSTGLSPVDFAAGGITLIANSKFWIVLPYWVDEMLNRSDIRADPATGLVAPGFPIRLSFSVSQLDAAGNPAPLPGAYVDVWHCNAPGVYSDVAAQNTTGMMFLRGYQVTDARGTARFTTIYPGWYSGRTVHIHFRVRVSDAATGEVTYNQVAQLFFDDQLTSRVLTKAPMTSGKAATTSTTGTRSTTATATSTAWRTATSFWRRCP